MCAHYLCKDIPMKLKTENNLKGKWRITIWKWMCYGFIEFPLKICWDLKHNFYSQNSWEKNHRIGGGEILKAEGPGHLI